MTNSSLNLDVVVDSLAASQSQLWLRETCGVTRSGRPIPALIDKKAYSHESTRHRILLVGGIPGTKLDVQLVFRATDLIARSDKVALSVVPSVDPDSLDLAIRSPANSKKETEHSYPPRNGYYFDRNNPETRYLWRWVCFIAPDVILEIRNGSPDSWESTDPSSNLSQELGTAYLTPSTSMLAALSINKPSGLAPIPGLRITTNESSIDNHLADFLNAILKRKTFILSPARNELANRMSRSPLDIGQLLADEYGHTLNPVVYTQGVAISGRLRLARLSNTVEETAQDIARLVDPIISNIEDMLTTSTDGAKLAGLIWCDELSEASGDSKYSEILVEAADQFKYITEDEPPLPCDPDYRSEDVFFAGSILGRAYRETGNIAYLNILYRFFSNAKIQQPNGLFWHARSVPYFWGRGNGFAALGYAEALSYMPKNYLGRDILIHTHQRHLRALGLRQHASGMLTQVLDVPGSYQEHTATCMFGYSLARGIRGGWLDHTYRPMLDLAWQGVAERITMQGGLVDGCTGTGPQSNLRGYLERPAISGHDDRTGNLALWFALEIEYLTRNQSLLEFKHRHQKKGLYN